MKEFAPFVYSGLVVWEFISGSVTAGCFSIIGASPYIMLRKLPLAIYPLRSVIASGVTSVVGLSGLLLWMLCTDATKLGFPLLSLAWSLPLIVLICWPLAIISGFINAKFRDFQQGVGLLLQAIWYVSPVFLDPSLFKAARIGFVVEYNPVTHVLNLVRSPLLAGCFPDPSDYIYAAATAGIFWFLAVRFIRRDEPTMAFFL